MTIQLKTKDIRLWREKLLKKQKGICPLCQEELIAEEAVLDHCHVTGHIRGALHNGCNRAEGKAINWIYRTKCNDPVVFAKNLSKYWNKDFSKLPVHPKHRTIEQKKEIRNAKARKARAKRNKK